MLLPTLIIIVRNADRSFSYSVITVGGLVVGLSTGTLIFLAVNYELGFDRDNPDRDRIFLSLTNELIDGEVQTSDEAPPMLVDFLTHDIPEVEYAARVDYSGGYLSNNETSVYKSGVYADHAFFKLLNLAVLN